MKIWACASPSDEPDASDIDASWERICQRRRRRRTARRVALALPGVALAFVVFVLWDPGLPIPATHLPPRAISLSDGSVLPAEWRADSKASVSLDDGSRIELEPSSTLRAGSVADPARVELSLDRGRATFDVKPGGPRAWVIDAHGVRVRVLGTRFSVRTDGDRVEVAVERGRVAIESSRIEGGARILGAGEGISVGGEPGDQPEHVAPSKASSAPLVEPVGPSANQEAAGKLARSADRLAARVEVARAVDRPTADVVDRRVTSPSPPTGDDPSDDPMARADAARRAGRPREAVTILSSLVEQGGREAALAAFTLGKIHVQDLAEPSRGATWFERAADLGLPAGLEEEARARVVESYALARRQADAGRARARYEASYPLGRHLQRVRSWAPRD